MKPTEISTLQCLQMFLLITSQNCVSWNFISIKIYYKCYCSISIIYL